MDRILFQNETCLVINKLKGEAAQGVAKDTTGKIVNLPKTLVSSFPNKEIIQAVNRIDVPVTGCVLFAFDKKSLSFLYSVFAGEYEKKAEKIYWAIVEKPEKQPPAEGELVHFIETNTRNNKTFVYTEETPERKKAVLRYRITGEGTNYLFMRIQLISGRHHQIRAQLAFIGLHIKGDVKYGARRNEKDGGIRLHARSLSFPNPAKKDELIYVEADPPQMDNLWQAFADASH